MSKTYTVPTTSPFFIQWHAQGSSGGQWNGSDTSSNDGFVKLDWWKIVAGQEYECQFSTKQGEGNAYTVFATVTDEGSSRIFGVRISPDGAPDTLTFKPKGNVVFAAGKLISDDPQIQITGSTSQPSTKTVEWDGTRWSDPDDPSWDGHTVIRTALGRNEGCDGQTLLLTVADKTQGGSNESALYEKLQDRVARLYKDQPPRTLDEGNGYETTYEISDEGLFIVNLFLRESDDVVVTS